MLPRRDADLNDAIGGPVGLRGAPGAAMQPGGARLEQASVYELVQVESGELSRDSDLRCGLISGDGFPGIADERIHTPPQIIGQRSNCPY
jgi:hypothetical protein